MRYRLHDTPNWEEITGKASTRSVSSKPGFELGVVTLCLIFKYALPLLSVFVVVVVVVVVVVLVLGVSLESGTGVG